MCILFMVKNQKKKKKTLIHIAKNNLKRETMFVYGIITKISSNIVNTVSLVVLM